MAGQTRSALTGRSLTAALLLSLLLLVADKGNAAQQGQDTSVCVGTKPDKCDVVDNGVVQVRGYSFLSLPTFSLADYLNISLCQLLLSFVYEP